MMYLTVKHMAKSYDLQVDEQMKIGELMTQLASSTGVPLTAQKLICRGKQVSLNQDTSLLQAGITNGDKIMLLGKKYDPTQEAAYKDIINIETKALLVETKYIKLCKEFEDIEKGHLSKEHIATAIKGLVKRANSHNEELHKLLASLDSVPVESDQTEIRNKRKSTATKINQIMDKNDELAEKLKNC
eukprot:TRINITY_DN2793_c1_g1_i7.p1 TRINITY_DN2793_c1_g1~~TRINITY_DN2793_c1_g1_i7.p1  ORF type:complete len:187 (+),score=18.88 TRINITY_DN2793_c1_g1_i7:59-619(+)